MPYQSWRQQAFMHINHPEVAKRWDAETKASGQPFPRKHADGDFMVPDPASFPRDQMRSFGGPPSNAANASMDKGDKEMRDYVENGPQSQEDWSRAYGADMAKGGNRPSATPSIDPSWWSASIRTSLPVDFSGKGSPVFQKVRDELSGIQHALPAHKSETPPHYNQRGQRRQRGQIPFHDMDMERRFPEAHHPIDSLMSHMSPREFRYKNPADGMSMEPGKNHRPFLGVMAQEIERDPSGYGSQIVRTTPHGKMLETKPLVSALTAGVGRLHDRVTQLEGHIKGLLHASHATHHRGAQPNEREQMLAKLHEIISRKTG